MSPAAASSDRVTGSRQSMSERIAPTNGAVEKYAPVRAVPRLRSPRTNSTRLNPYPNKPSKSAEPILDRGGSGLPRTRPIARLTLPATPPPERRDLNRIAGRHFLGEIVVDRPAEAGPRDQEGTEEPAPLQPSLPGEKCSARHDRHHSQHDPPIHILSKQRPGQDGREYTFEIEQQGCRGGWGVGQPLQEQQGSEESPEPDGAAEPGEVAPGEDRFPYVARSTSPKPPRSQAQPGPEIEETGKKLGRHTRQQPFGERRAGAEEQGGTERRLDTAVRSFLHGRALLYHDCWQRLPLRFSLAWPGEIYFFRAILMTAATRKMASSTPRMVQRPYPPMKP